MTFQNKALLDHLGLDDFRQVNMILLVEFTYCVINFYNDKMFRDFPFILHY